MPSVYVGPRITQLYLAGMSTVTMWDMYCYCAVATRILLGFNT